MAEIRLSESFNLNLFFWKVFGLWPGRETSKYYKYFSFSYLFITLITYNVLLIFNLIYTPRTIEFLIREVIFLVTEVAVTSKVLMVLFKRKQILESFDLLDCEFFKGDEEVSKVIVKKSFRKYLTSWKLYAILSNFAYSSQVVIPILSFWISGAELVLPICKYYFLSNEFRSTYFNYIFIYQSFGMYGHMMYNVNIDSFMAGLILYAVTQLKVVNSKLNNLKLNSISSTPEETKIIQDKAMMLKLIDILKHYDFILRYYNNIQDVINITMFVQFGMASLIICVVLCGLTMPSSTETMMFMFTYLFAMTLQIFVPAWLGTLLTFENQQLAFAAYSSDWIPRCSKFKRSLRLFVTRANSPLELRGLKMFPLGLYSFTSIMKTAYSFFALIRNVQDRQNQE